MIEVLIQDRVVCRVQPGGDPLRRELDERTDRLPAESLADAIAALFEGERWRVREIRLVIPASWCYAHRFAVAHRRPTHAMLAFAFEEYLPLEAERLAADFVRIGATDWLGIGIETQRMAPLLTQLADHGFSVESIQLDALRYAPCDLDGWFESTDEVHCAFVEAHRGRLRGLRIGRATTPAASPAITDRLRTDIERLTPEALDRLVTLRQRETDLAALGPGLEPAVELARGPLAPPARADRHLRRLRTAAQAACVAAVILVGGLITQRNAMQRELNDAAQWERALFTQAFPGQPVPVGAALRLQSEQRRLAALTQADRPDAAQPRPDVLRTLQCVVAAIPTEARIDVQELRIEWPEVTLRGRVRDHQQAERISRSVDATPEFECEAARTDRQSDGTVLFFIHARHAPAAEPSKERAP